MDILAHGLWAWVGGEALHRRGRITRSQQVSGIAFALAPDLIQMIPIFVGLFIGQVTWAQLVHYAFAHPGQEPVLQEWISESAHHLHCAMHSLVILGVVTLIARLVWPALLYPLLGWWLHVATDIPTHSADYYAVPVFYPFTYRGFDGVAWNSPGFMVLNYLALVVAGFFVLRQRRHSCAQDNG